MGSEGKNNVSNDHVEKKKRKRVDCEKSSMINWHIVADFEI